MRPKRVFRLGPGREICLGELFGREADEIYISPHGITLPGFGMKRWGYRELAELFYTHTGYYNANQTIRQLREDLAAAQEARAAAERTTAWYRRQLRLESSFGLMLERIAG